MESIYTELALYGSKNECARTDNVYFTMAEVWDGTVSLRDSQCTQEFPSSVFSLYKNTAFGIAFAYQPVPLLFNKIFSKSKQQILFFSPTPDFFPSLCDSQLHRLLIPAIPTVTKCSVQ